jgi:hypothetical protein
MVISKLNGGVLCKIKAEGVEVATMKGVCLTREMLILVEK